MSTAGDIWDVYQAEIADKSRLVYRRGGAMPFFNGIDLRIKSLFQVPGEDEGYIYSDGCSKGDIDDA